MARPNCPRCGKEFQPELYWWHCQGCGYVVTKNAHTRAYGKLSKSKRERELEAALRKTQADARVCLRTYAEIVRKRGGYQSDTIAKEMEFAAKGFDTPLAGSAAQTAGTPPQEAV